MVHVPTEASPDASSSGVSLEDDRGLTRSLMWMLALSVGVATLTYTLNDSWTYLSIASLLDWVHSVPYPGYDVVVAVGFPVQAAAVLLLRRHPVAGLTVAGALYAVFGVWLATLTWAHGGMFTLAIAGFFVAARGRRTTAVILAIVTAGGAVAANLAYLSADQNRGLRINVVTSLQRVADSIPLVIAGFLVGALWGVHARRAAAHRRAAERERLTAVTRVAQAREVERLRIAQELHDVAAQHLSGLVTLADTAGELAANDPSVALSILPDLRAEGRYAAASIYGALGDLRAGNDVRATPTPDLGAVDALADWWAARRVTIRATLIGDVREIPPVLSVTGYRIVHEAVANAVKHAPGSPIEVSVAIDADAVHIHVTNPCTAPESSDSRDDRLGCGWGLPSLRARVALIDGTLTAGPGERGAWIVDATLPLVSALLGEEMAA